jgi:hypothetical protein
LEAIYSYKENVNENSNIINPSNEKRFTIFQLIMEHNPTTLLNDIQHLIFSNKLAKQLETTPHSQNYQVPISE